MEGDNIFNYYNGYRGQAYYYNIPECEPEDMLYINSLLEFNNLSYSMFSVSLGTI